MSRERKTVFLDRDGVINRKAAPHDYIKNRKEFEFLPGVQEAIRKLNEAGYLVLVVTNQKGIARGIMTMEEREKKHESTGNRRSRVYRQPYEQVPA